MKLISTFLFCFLFFQVNAQGWDKTLNDSLKIINTTPTNDGGCALFGWQTVSNKAIVLKIDANGKSQWSKSFTNFLPFDEIYVTGRTKIMQDKDDNYWLSVSNYASQDASIMKLDKNGNQLLARTLAMDNVEAHVLDNQFVLLGVSKNPNELGQAMLLRYNLNGDTLSKSLYPSIQFYRARYYTSYLQKTALIIYTAAEVVGSMRSIRLGFDGTVLAINPLFSNPLFTWPMPAGPIVKTLDGGFIIPDSVFTIKLDSLGRFVWRKSLGVVNRLGPNSPYFRNYIAPINTNGDFMVIQQNIGATNYLESRRFTADGTLKNSNFLLYNNTLNFPFLIRTSKGGFVFAGNTSETKVRLLKFDDNGYFYPNFIKGNVFSDIDNTCTLTANDAPVPKALILAQKTGQPDVLALSDSLGKYNMNVDVGTYNISIVNPNRYMYPCTPSVSKTISATNTKDSADFVLKSSFFCALMQVDVTTPRLRRCFNNNYTVNYCNKGTALATGAYVNITLDSLLEFISAEKPVASRTGRTYRFNLGNIAINDCSSFDIVTRVRCGDSTRLNQTLCVNAKIYPDTICNYDNSLWSGANLSVTGTCQGDSVLFEIRNTGTVAAPATSSIVIQNDITSPLSISALPANGAITKKFAANGNTWRMVVNQVSNHPRSVQPTAFVEGCRKSTTSSFVTGFASGFSSDDSDISVDMDCQPLVGSFDPNDKTGYPIGTGSTKAIGQNTDLEYIIRFQNTGTDTAFTVAIRDTIDANLDILSIEWGASSHKYKPEIYGKNIVKFTFDNIQLVDSFRNEPKSNGFVKFRIKQKKDLAFGTKIQNSAGIYFDFNEPVLTNKTLHTISKSLVSALPYTPTSSYEMVKVYPNPTSQSALFELTDTPLPTVSGSAISITTFELSDLTGKRIRQESFEGKTFEFHRQSLPTGLYLFKMINDGKVLGVGKLVIQ